MTLVVIHALLLVVIVLPMVSTDRSTDTLSCHQHNVVRYRATFIGAWSEETFPKQYPSVRPPAQFSKIIGRSHDESYRMWSVGKLASIGFKKFAQEGSSELLDKMDTQGFDGIFDSFTSPPLAKGVAEMELDFFASSSHQKVSLAARLIPSPDWFVGLDSFVLCRNNSWFHELTVPLLLIDAGTDRGFTFTSPKWESRPQEPMYRISSQYPNHKVSSFYYPDSPHLPEIGYVKFELLVDYKRRKVHKEVRHRRDEDEIEQLKEDSALKRERLEEQQILHGEPVYPSNMQLLPSMTKLDTNKSYTSLPKLQSKLITSTLSTRTTLASRIEFSEVVQFNSSHLNKQSKQAISSSRKLDLSLPKVEKKDCLVSEWSTWSMCSKSCGFGVQKRQRKVTQVPVQGRPCPNMVQEKWCGGMRNCRDQMKLFSWLNRNIDE